MTKTIKKQDYQALYEELEAKYGPALAQEIIDQIRKVEDEAYLPDYMPMKALSEVTEEYRSEAQSLLKQIKGRRTRVRAEGKGIAYLDEKRLQNDFVKKWGIYRLTQNTYFTLYHRVMRVLECPKVYRYRTVSNSPIAKQAA
jgi:hypothetical protein